MTLTCQQQRMELQVGFLYLLLDLHLQMELILIQRPQILTIQIIFGAGATAYGLKIPLIVQEFIQDGIQLMVLGITDIGNGYGIKNG